MTERRICESGSLATPVICASLGKTRLRKRSMTAMKPALPRAPQERIQRSEIAFCLSPATLSRQPRVLMP